MSEAYDNEILREHIKYVSQHSPFYQELFKRNKINPDNIRSTKDLAALPFTTKSDLQEKGKDFVCVPKNKLIDHVTTSGTTGKPVTLSLTDKDLERLSLNECNSFQIAGLTHNDLIQLMTTADRRFMAGLAYFLGARKLGAGIIRVGNGLPELQWSTILDMKPSVLIGVPSFLIKLIEHAEKNNIELKNTSVTKVICIGEPIRNQDFTLNTLGKKIIDKWQIQLHSTYASSEMATAFTECENFQGGHVQEDLIITEIINEEGNPVKKGEAGELVVTPLGVEGMPLLRFRTGDICSEIEADCACGRKGKRLGPVLGRKSQMIKYRGTTLYPNAVYEVLESIPEVDNYQVHIYTGDLGTDEISINLGVREAENLSITKISDTFKARLRVVPKLNFLSPSQVSEMLFPDESRKPQLFVDKRRT